MFGRCEKKMDYKSAVKKSIYFTLAQSIFCIAVRQIIKKHPYNFSRTLRNQGYFQNFQGQLDTMYDYFSELTS